MDVVEATKKILDLKTCNTLNVDISAMSLLATLRKYCQNDDSPKPENANCSDMIDPAVVDTIIQNKLFVQPFNQQWLDILKLFCNPQQSRQLSKYIKQQKEIKDYVLED